MGRHTRFDGSATAKGASNHKFGMLAVLFIAAMCAALALGFAPGQAQALTDSMGNQVNKKYTVSCFNGIVLGDAYYLSDWGKTLSDVTSINKDVLEVRLEGSSTIFLTAKKPGTAKIKYKSDGAAKSLKVNVVMYKNPLKSFKIGGVQYASSFNNWSYASIEANGKKKVKVVPASGWQIVRMRVDGQELVNGKKLPAESWSTISVTLVENKSGHYEQMRMMRSPSTTSS